MRSKTFACSSKRLERAPHVDTNIYTLLDRLTAFGQMLKRFERVIEVAHRFAVR